MIGEVIDFNQAIQATLEWVNDPLSPANWENTIILVTADHETGYLTQAPSVFANQPLGEVSPRTLQLEKNCLTTCLRASWEDTNGNREIDTNETVYWAWNSASHTNSLVPLFVFGAMKISYPTLIKGRDPVRGDFIDNTDIYWIMKAALFHSFNLYLPIIYR